jgi:hypothetical protein
VVHDDESITVNLAGLRDEAAGSRIEVELRRLLENEGLEVPPIRINPVTELRRGKTGKAPLILSVAALGRHPAKAATP